VTGFAREVAAGFGHAITLEQVALLAEFEDDTSAVNRLMNDFCNGRTGQHVAEAIRQERAEAAAREQLTAQLTADGYAITTHYPDGRLLLTGLACDGQDLTPEAHAACPGRAAYLNPYSQGVTHFCTDPEANGHARRHQGSSLPDLGHGSDDTTGGADASPEHRADPGPDPARRLVIEGNRAWTAAASVRKRWLADSLLARRTAPKEAMPFITSQLLLMPAPLRDAITHAARSSHFDEITGGSIKAAETGTWPAGRLPVAILALIAAAYEERMDGDSGRETWRTDRPYPRCPRDDARAYFRFLATVGYELAAIEQAVADGVPYTGDQPADDLTSADEPDGDVIGAEPGEPDPGAGATDGEMPDEPGTAAEAG
jgi:ParB family chromosome partitioning protein